ncbi:hypothetical protein OPV22_034075 [Ensete ventricosum]|uniref:Disease resistance N-terminal domain-containing protein n=1 Tax=Ensete ventricosum TaxID=4639 RepID=A0AAV8PVX5_ENSVE|nr:hypothetical protein OPV22_034075 [Ensete ventricosum]
MVTTLWTLEDAEERQLQDKLVRYWLAKLKDVAYDMDELLDKCAAAKIRWEMEMEMESRAELRDAGRWLLLRFLLAQELVHWRMIQLIEV